MKNSSGFHGGSANRFDTKIHTDQIRAYLPMLTDKAIQLINESQEQTDSVIPGYGGQYTNAYHFDNNKLAESTAKINEAYRYLLDNFSGKPEMVFKYFGRITHALQDFYSHSNWYELSREGFTGDQRLLDEGYGFFEELKPLKRIGDTRIVALERGFRDPVTEWGSVGEWQVDRNTYVVSATTDQGERIGGLMSGEVNGILYGNGNSVTITDPLTNQTYPGFDHGGLAGTVSKRFLGPLAKDTTKAKYHMDVLALARDQVQHEFVRMLGLISDRYGRKGLREFANQFVRESYQDEFFAMMRSNGFSAESLEDNNELNTLNDNGATDQVLQSFFKDGNPDVDPIPDNHPIPREIARYSKEIEDGDFRWVALGGVPENDGDFLLQIKRSGEWTTTTFTSDDMLSFR